MIISNKNNTENSQPTDTERFLKNTNSSFFANLYKVIIKAY